MATVDSIHPGLLVRRECLEPHGLTVTEAAWILGVSRQALSNLLSGRAGISPEMALRLDLAFGGGPEAWMQRQLAYDLAEARKALPALKVHPLTARPPREAQTALF
jgi:addiction module HigA family antidote